MESCSKCRAVLPPGAAFCPACGKKQATTPRKKKSRSHANGMGTVFKRGKSWYCERTLGWRLREDGTRQRIMARKGGFKTSADAWAYLPQLTAAPAVLPQRITFADLYDRWLSRHSDLVTHDTLNCYKAAYKHFAPLHYVPFAEIKTEALQQCIDACPLSKSSLQKMRALASLLYEYAMQNDLVDRNYASFLRTKGAEGDPRQPFTQEQLQTMFHKRGAVAGLDYVLCLCYTGLRLNEFLSIKVTDLHSEILPDGRTVWYVVGGSKTEAGRNRVVPIAPAIQSLVQSFAILHEEYLFSPTGRRITDKTFRNTVYYPALEKAGLPRLVPHCCRHTFSTLLKDVEGNKLDKMRIVGHSDEKTSNHYTHSQLAELSKITDQLR